MKEIKHYRTILGDKYRYLTEQQVESIVNMLYNVSSRIINTTIKEKIQVKDK